MNMMKEGDAHIQSAHALLRSVPRLDTAGTSLASEIIVNTEMKVKSLSELSIAVL